MTPVAWGAIAAVVFLLVVTPLVLLVSPFIAQIVDDARRPKPHRLQRHADYRQAR